MSSAAISNGANARKRLLNALVFNFARESEAPRHGMSSAWRFLSGHSNFPKSSSTTGIRGNQVLEAGGSPICTPGAPSCQLALKPARLPDDASRTRVAVQSSPSGAGSLVQPHAHCPPIQPEAVAAFSPAAISGSAHPERIDRTFHGNGGQLATCAAAAMVAGQTMVAGSGWVQWRAKNCSDGNEDNRALSPLHHFRPAFAAGYGQTDGLTGQIDKVQGWAAGWKRCPVGSCHTSSLDGKCSSSSTGRRRSRSWISGEHNALTPCSAMAVLGLRPVWQRAFGTANATGSKSDAGESGPSE
jgi:hypothetical protein